MLIFKTKTMKKITLKTATFGILGLGFISLLGWLLTSKTRLEPNLIVISKNKVRAGTDFDKWEEENSKCYYSDQSGAGIICNDNVVLDLNEISADDGNKVRNWLEKYSKFICFEDSYKYIEKAHLIKDVVYIDNIERASNKRDISYKEIKDKTNVFFVLSNNKFDDRGYEGYLNFFKPNFTDIKFMYDYGLIGEGRYSIPFIRSIKASVVKKFNNPNFLEEDIKFTFVKVVSPAGNEAIAFRVVAGPNNEFKQYYNFSTDPGKPITVMLL